MIRVTARKTQLLAKVELGFATGRSRSPLRIALVTTVWWHYKSMTLGSRLRESNALWHRQMLLAVPICIAKLEVMITSIDCGPLAGRVPITPAIAADSKEILLRSGQGRLHFLYLTGLCTLGAHSSA